jgi:amino acid adenylation domain-containing protein
MTYEELHRASARLAHALRSTGVGRDEVVAVVLPRSARFVVAVAAVLRAGGAYLPVDPEYPTERQNFMISESGAKVVLCSTATHVQAREAVGRARLIDLDADADWIDAMPFHPPRADVTKASAAYIIYTSGSTGRPKGVVVEHGNLANLIAWHQSRFALNSKARAALFASVGFDASVWEMWPYLASNSTIFIGPKLSQLRSIDTANWLARNRITHTFLPAFLIPDLQPFLPNLESLRYVFTGGERLRLSACWEGSSTLVNAYGPTEATVLATASEVSAADGLVPHIGTPVAGAAIYLLDAEGRPVEAGEQGEIYIGGAGVARGYVNDDELTNSRFIADPFSGRTGTRMYRTGDLAAERADGSFEFCGRVDRQLKVRGFRIEPAEVEAALCALAGVSQAVVVPYAESPDTAESIVAFVVGEPPVKVRDLRRELASKLPSYLMPDVIEKVNHIPITFSGKRDDQTLIEIHIARKAMALSEPVEGTEVEDVVCAIWIEVLGIEEVHSDDDFFDLGGDSIGIIRICHILETKGYRMEIDQAYSNPTPRGQAGLLLSASDN